MSDFEPALLLYPSSDIQCVSQATYGTGIVLDADQRKPAPGPKDTYAYHVLKRGFDVAFSACSVVGCAIPVAVVCWLIYLDEPGFPLYRQCRVGRYGLPVEIYKLRTMVPDADCVERHLTPEQVEQWGGPAAATTTRSPNRSSPR